MAFLNLQNLSDKMRQLEEEMVHIKGEELERKLKDDLMEKWLAIQETIESGRQVVLKISQVGVRKEENIE